jgi:hypothetical protein
MSRRLAHKFETNDPKRFIEVSVSYNKPPEYIDDRLPKTPYYLVAVTVVKREGAFEVRTAYSGYKTTLAAPERYNAGKLIVALNDAVRADYALNLVHRVAAENDLEVFGADK